MKFHMLSGSGEGCGLLKRIQDEGNDCTINIDYAPYARGFEGVLKRAKEPPKNAIVICDTSGLGKECDELKKKGFKVFGGSKFADKLEQERDFGLEFMKKHEIKTPDTKVFTTFWDAIDWLKGIKNDKNTYVFKPNGKDLPCRLTYCATDNEDLISYLHFVLRYFNGKIDDFVLQTFVEGPIVSTEFWVGPKGFIHPANHTVEVKKFLNDDLGPSTGCAGNLVWAAEEDEITAALENMEEELVEQGYVGPIDLNAILSSNGLRGLEWTPRFGLDAMPTLLTLIDGEVGKLISDIVHGLTDEMELQDAVAGGVRITIPPYPIEPTNDVGKVLKEAPNTGVPIRDLDTDNTYFYEIMVQDGELVHSPGTGVIAVISDFSENLEDVLDYPYEILEGCRIPDKQYRTDLQGKLAKMAEEACEALEYVRSE